MIQPINRHKSLALVTMLALVPMVIVVTTVSVMLVSRVLRVQREATYRVTNTEKVVRMVNQMRNDAATAQSVTLDADQTRLTFVGSDDKELSVYTVQDKTVVRSAQSVGDFQWTFIRATVEPSIETIENAAPVVWLRLEYEIELQKRIVKVAEMATAIHIGDPLAKTESLTTSESQP